MAKNDHLHSLQTWDFSDIAPPDHPIASLASRSLSSLTGLRSGWNELRDSVDDRIRQRREALDAVTARLRKSTDGSADRRYAMPLAKRREYLSARRRFDSINYVGDNLGQLFVDGAVAELNLFLSVLFDLLIRESPNVLTVLHEATPTKVVLDASSLEDAHQAIRESATTRFHDRDLADQLAVIETLLGQSLALPSTHVDRLVELRSRELVYRLHGGLCTRAHREVQEKAYSSATQVGERVHTTDRYVDDAFALVFEFIVRVSQRAWRARAATEPTKNIGVAEVDAADKFLSRICYSLLVFEAYALAASILDFALDEVTISSDYERRVLLVNRAQASKWQDDDETCFYFLESLDWSAADSAFQLAIAVLTEDYERAQELMLSLGRNDELPPAAFLEWPLFQRFRETDHFETAFHELYDRPPPT